MLTFSLRQLPRPTPCTLGPSHGSEKRVVLCPLAELGYLRVSTHPKVLNLSMTDARKALEQFVHDHQATRIDDDLPALGETGEVGRSYRSILGGISIQTRATPRDIRRKYQARRR